MLNPIPKVSLQIVDQLLSKTVQLKRFPRFAFILLHTAIFVLEL